MGHNNGGNRFNIFIKIDEIRSMRLGVESAAPKPSLVRTQKDAPHSSTVIKVVYMDLLLKYWDEMN